MFTTTMRAGRIVDPSRATKGGRDPGAEGEVMDRRHRQWGMVAHIDPPELDTDGLDDAVRETEMLLGVPEWVDPDTGQLADDEHVRLESH